MGKLNVGFVRTVLVMVLITWLIIPALAVLLLGPTSYVVVYLVVAAIAEFLLPHLGEMKTSRQLTPILAVICRQAHWIVLGLFLVAWEIHRLQGEFPVWALVGVIIGHVMISWIHKIELKTHKRPKKEDSRREGEKLVAG
jgi:fructose-specific phosphotransferase system IIC component